MCNCKSPIQLISPNNKHEMNHNYFISQLTGVDPEFWKNGSKYEHPLTEFMYDGTSVQNFRL